VGDDVTLYVVTGGPGAGKTSLIDALAAAGYSTFPESGRAIIREQISTGGRALPWDDREAFAQAMETADRDAYARLQNRDGPVFLDRGLPDIIGYRILSGLPISPALNAACQTTIRYASPVFIAPPWPDIYATDSERRQDAAEAERIFSVMRATYTGLGYALIELPRVPVAERVAFILHAMGVPAV
jgi:predicted ATPase